MAVILQIETSTSACSVALSDNGRVISAKEKTEPNIHAGFITLFIDEIMKTTGTAYSELDAVAVSKGPGSYTGLRIGVSTAKGLCYALDIPLLAIDTLHAMAAGFLKFINPEITENTLLCPMIDARRMEVYMSVFDNKLSTVEPVQAKILEEGCFDDYLLTKRMFFFGDGAFKVNAIYPGNENVSFTAFDNSATHLSELAFNKFKLQQFEDLAYFEPYYLKDFVAGKAKV